MHGVMGVKNSGCTLICATNMETTGNSHYIYCGHHGTTAACLDYRGVCISENSGIFLVGVAMHTHAVEYYEGAV